jgi:hypothetical protein
LESYRAILSIVDHQLREVQGKRGTVVIQSMFNLEHRLADLRPTAEEQRTARQLRASAGASQAPAVVTVRRWFGRGANPTRLTRVTAS